MTNYFSAHLSVILLCISLAASQLRNEHQNNPLVSAETVCHSSTYISVCLLAPMCGGKTPRLQWYSSSCIYGDNVHQYSHIHTLHEGNVSMETRESG